MKVLITGATGFVGRALVARARERGHEVVITSRDAARAKELLGVAAAFFWDPTSGPVPSDALMGVEAVIHLAGENVASGRWTKRRMTRIRDSRVVGTRHVVSAMGAQAKRPKTFVCASAIGWYGDRQNEALTESSPPGDDFLAWVCRDWEGEAAKVEEQGVRWVSLRTGIVLGRGGALAKMLTPFRLNLGGPLAGGRQWMSWIHREDLVGLYLHALEQESLRGPALAVAPQPVTNAEFTKTLGYVLGKWTFMPMPGFMLRLVVGKFARVLVSSQRCTPEVAMASGYAFRYPSLERALRQVLSEI